MAALPIVPQNTANRGALQAMSLKDMTVAEQQQKEALENSQKVTPQEATGLAAIVRRDWDIFQRHRNTISGWSLRLLDALRQFNGQYDPTKLAQIKQFGGSDIYARLTAVKCRGTSALLRDVYLSDERPWGFEPPSDPEIPVEQYVNISQAVEAEVKSQSLMTGQIPSQDDVKQRTLSLIEAARNAALKAAAKRADIAEDKVNTLLQVGGFYDALTEFLTDIPIYPFAVLKGPVVKMVPVVKWHNGAPYPDTVPRLTWQRVSPFDIWFTPGVSRIENATMIERLRVTRAQLNDLLDLPGYNHDAVKDVLTTMPNGYTEAPDYTDSQRAVMESRENPVMNESLMYDMLEYHGNVQGFVLEQAGMARRLIPDLARDYAVEIWMISSYILKLQLSPSPRKRHPYFLTSMEKVPGTPVGNALPDTIGDLQDAANATLRSLVNNMAMASGPQVVVHDDRLSGQENGESIYPWKRWHVISDPLGAPTSSSYQPVEFFQPTDNSQSLLQVFQAFYSLADDVSAIPRYLQGSSPGGAGRTASGLAMLMGNASKVLQTICANIDVDVISQSLQELLDLVLMTDTTDILDGTEKVRVKGVQMAMQRETERSRQMELLAATANPIDMQIMGPRGRAELLRAVTKNVGIPGGGIVPTDQELQQQQEQAAAMAKMQGKPGHAMGPDDQGAKDAQGNKAQTPNQDQGPRTNLIPSRVSGGGSP